MAINLSKNQKIGIGVGIAALLLLIIGKSKNWWKKEVVTLPETKPASNTTTVGTKSSSGTTAYKYSADGLSDNEKAIETYKTLIGTAAYIKTSEDLNAAKVRDIISQVAMGSAIGTQSATMNFITKANRGKECLKEAVKMIGKNLDEHVNYFIENGKFLIEK